MHDKLDLFIKMTQDRFDKLDGKIDKLWEFRFLILGGSIVVSALLTTVISAAAIYFGVR